MTFKDKLAQVYITSLELFDILTSDNNNSNEKMLVSTTDPLIKIMVEKLGDNNARINQKSYESLLKLCDHIQPQYI